MARIKIHFPPQALFTAAVPVRITDINYGHHVGNDSFVAIVHEARVLFLQHLGYSELDIEGLGLIMADLGLEFKNEAFYGDIITIKIALGEINKVSFELLYQLSTRRNQTEILLAQAKTGMVCFNYSQKKIAPIPDKFLQAL
jgi:acyl-CoA thioester hydrolase